MTRRLSAAANAAPASQPVIPTIPPTDVLSRLAALQMLPTAELKQQWRDLFGKEPPPFNRAYIQSRLAYRIQELAYGGLKPETRARLEALGEQLDGGNVVLRRIRADSRPLPGTRLIREYDGVQHVVTVEERDRCVDEVRMARRPHSFAASFRGAVDVQPDLALERVAGELVGVVSEVLPVLVEADPQAQPRWMSPVQPHRDPHGRAHQIRGPAEVDDVRCRDSLDPDLLPDAGGAPVPDRVRLELPVLLSARL